ncbi:MAG TPA: two-component system regulatory protein YycI [Candidatus Limosilactobacillus gallistercoris]|nr:two-component system regulatory protein YycI [Candidatus Limosilactobacillus gallistercoris]
MNFKRIQWIFLFAFLIFDLVVAGSLFFQNRFTISSSAPNRQEVILKEMRSDAITSVDLSNHAQSGYYIAGTRSGESGELGQQAAKLRDQSYHFNSGELASDLETGVKIDLKHPEKRLNRLVGDNRSIALGSHYRYSPQLSDRHTVVYAQQLAGRALNSPDGQIRFRVNNNSEVLGYTQTYLENTRILRPEATTISQQHAVTWLYKHNLIPNNSQVRWAKLAYTKLLNTSSHNQAVYIPTWIIEVRTKNDDTVQQLRVNAFNSTIMRSKPGSVNTSSLGK